MAGEYGQEGGFADKFFTDLNTRLRDLEEKQRLLRDKMLLVTRGFIEEKNKSFTQIQELRKDVEVLKMDNNRMKEILMKVSELVDKSARKEDLLILQRQFDIFRE